MPLFFSFSRVKCPFRGPFEFTYSKGASGQTCSYPKSYMDSCEGGTKVRLRYQACLDVAGSESRDESFSCLATWKEGSLRGSKMSTISSNFVLVIIKVGRRVVTNFFTSTTWFWFVLNNST